VDLPTSAPPAVSLPIKGSGPEFKRTGPEHFSPLADLQTPPSEIPPCRCGQPSVGGIIVGQAPSSVSGCPALELEFFCQVDLYGQTPQVMSYALNPHYHHVSGMDSRRMYRRLSREEAIQRVGGRA
jgi:hypothetical protein